MKKRPTKKPSGRAQEKPAAAKKSAAAEHLGGQPENDEDAQAAGFESATAQTSRKPAKAKSAQEEP